MENKFKTVIRSKRKIFDLKLREVIEYKDLIFLFVKRDFIAFYKQTILGPLWAVIKPLLTTFIFMLVFGSIAHLETYDTVEMADFVIPGFLFYLSGTICWNYFSVAVDSISQTFLKNRTIMGKVYYPRLVSPIASSFSGLISFAIQFALFIIVWAIYLIMGNTSIVVSVNLLFIPLCVLEMMILSLGVGIIISSLTTKYRDLQMLVGFGLQLWQYMSPVAYGLVLAQSKSFFNVYMLNPMTPIITTFRYAVFGNGYFDLMYYLISWSISIVILFIGLLLFNKVERTFMDTI